jgi:hypothetical protein
MFGAYLHVDSSSKILEFKTDIFNDIQFPTARHPLIIYAASMNGSSWENALLFDSLTKAGYVIAAISSVGKYPGFMTEAIDLDEQVQDILFAESRIKKLPFIDSTQIGLLSWSLGGSAITKAAMVSEDFKCMLSFDGTEIHFYGFDTGWDRQFKNIMVRQPFDPAAITIPYLYLSSDHPDKFDSVYVFPSHIRSKDNYFLRLVGASHEDFSSLITIGSILVPKSENADSGRHQIISKLTLTFFDQYLKQSESNATAAYLKQLLGNKPKSYSDRLPGK